MSWFEEHLESFVEEHLESLVERETKRFLDSQKFRTIAHGAFIEGMSRALAHAVPKTRTWFMWAIVADAVTRWGYSEEEARRIAPSLMLDLEEACAPWGDPDYDWSVGAAREWTQECLASDESEAA